MPPKIDKKENHPNLAARIPPHSLEAEQAVLGCVMIDEGAAVSILNDLKSDDFYAPQNRDILAAMQQIFSKNKPVDIVTLVTELEALGRLEAAGGLSYLTTLSNAVPSAANYGHYSAIVQKNALLRKLIDAGQRIIDKSFTGDIDDNALAFAEEEIFAIAKKRERSSLLELRAPLNEVIQRIEFLHKNPDAARGIPTGFKRLDKILNGFQPSDLILVAARPGQGKTSIGMNFLQHAVFDTNRRTPANKPDPYKCAVFSVEMSAQQIVKRLLCSEAGVNMSRVNSGDLTAKEWKNLYAAKVRLDNAHMYIDASGQPTPAEILSKCRRLQREKGLDLVLIDYLQLLSAGKRTDNRQQEVAEITRALKLGAKDLGVPIILLSQMSREIEKRSGDKKPQMSDLRESGAIEQDADVIVFIHRKHAPDDPNVDPETRNKVQLIIAKHRNGELGTVDVLWHGETVTFKDLEYAPRSAPPETAGGSFTMSDSAEEPVAIRSVKEILNTPMPDKDDDIW
ncbi:MAG: replicative DNA helicase [Firmicutes bacterium]|nr:replicative DNA helicase [Bacillota bacterium]